MQDGGLAGGQTGPGKVGLLREAVGDSWSGRSREGEGKGLQGGEQSVWVPELPGDWREVWVALVCRPRWEGARGGGRQVPRAAEALPPTQSGEKAACAGRGGTRLSGAQARFTGLGPRQRISPFEPPSPEFL